MGISVATQEATSENNKAEPSITRTEVANSHAITQLPSLTAGIAAPYATSTTSSAFGLTSQLSIPTSIEATMSQDSSSTDGPIDPAILNQPHDSPQQTSLPTQAQAINDFFEACTIPNLNLPPRPRNINEARVAFLNNIHKLHQLHNLRIAHNDRINLDYGIQAQATVQSAVEILSMQIGLRYLEQVNTRYERDPTNYDFRLRIMPRVVKRVGEVMRDSLNIVAPSIRTMRNCISDLESRSAFQNNVAFTLYQSFCELKSRLMVLDSIRRDHPGLVDNTEANYADLLGVTRKYFYITIGPGDESDEFLGRYDNMWINPLPQAPDHHGTDGDDDVFD